MLIFLFLCSLIMCYLIFLLSMIFESNETSKFQPYKYGLVIGWGEAKGWVLHPYLCPRPPCIVLSCLVSTPLCILGKIFSPHPCPLELREAPSHPVKYYFLLIWPQLLQIFLIKQVLFIKIYLKLQINLFHQIIPIFSKNWKYYPSV